MNSRSAYPSVWGIVLLVLILISINDTASYAQSKFNAAIKFTLGTPQGEYRRNFNDTGFGFSVFGGYCPGNSYLFFGVEGGLISNNLEESREHYPPYVTETNKKNSIKMFHFVVRTQKRTGIFQPFAEGLIGVIKLSRSTSSVLYGITSPVEYDRISSTSVEDFSDSTFGHGIGCGTRINIVKKGKGNPVYIELHVRYLWGGKAEYVKDTSINQTTEEITFNYIKSHTDLLLFQMGLMFTF
ncbi:hypothetical protein ACFL7D_01835 [candidate division KSB1 bacterium]